MYFTSIYIFYIELFNGGFNQLPRGPKTEVTPLISKLLLGRPTEERYKSAERVNAVTRGVLVGGQRSMDCQQFLDRCHL